MFDASNNPDLAIYTGEELWGWMARAIGRWKSATK